MPTIPKPPRAGTESLEIERKFEVPQGARFPRADEFARAGLTLGVLETHQLHARYFDTADGALARLRIAVRRREGGTDEGWHLKEKGEHGTRELHWPLSPRLPAGLAHELRLRIGAAVDEVRPLAELRTDRRAARLSDVDGVEVVELADDQVLASDLRDGEGMRVDRAWREWEAELMPGADRVWLERVAAVLAGAGAEPSPSSAKIARATGALVAQALAANASPEVVERLREMDRLDREAARRLEA